jgi:site-specific DNA-methyltransferase (adenine-specific)
VNRPPLSTVLVGDARQRLAELPEASIDCVVTSPPYFRLRDYGTAGQIGLEASVTGWVDELRVVLRGVARVLKPSGSVWLNLGDSYSRHPRYGAPAKGLLFGPERLALALIEDGWTVRNKVVWAKTNTLPTSVRDRLACTHEAVYFLTRTRQYFFDLDAVRVPHRSTRAARRQAAGPLVPTPTTPPAWAGPLAGTNGGLARLKAAGLVGHPLGKNPGDVWQLAASNYRGAHFATFPEALVVRPLLASCPERVCAGCGAPWQRQPARQVDGHYARGALVAGCQCRAGFRAGLVLDPFMGAGTVGVVAVRHGRDWLGIELNPAFARLARERIAAVRGGGEGDGGDEH